MLRLIAKLDIKGPNLIKGVQYEGNRVLGHAEAFSRRYYEELIDEIVYQDAVASLYRRNSLTEIVASSSKGCFIPLTVAGGIRSVENARTVLLAGADKIGVNTAALENPHLITALSRAFGRQCVVVVVESFRDGKIWNCWKNYGRDRTDRDVLDWVKHAQDLGAGEVLLSSVDRDGLGQGFDLELAAKVVELLEIPVLISGGAGSIDDIVTAARIAKPDGIVLSSVLHYYYATPQRNPTLNFKDAALRLGANVDSGNVDFLREGYGGDRSLYVNPASVINIKNALLAANIQVRVPKPANEVRHA